MKLALWVSHHLLRLVLVLVALLGWVLNQWRGLALAQIKVATKPKSAQTLHNRSKHQPLRVQNLACHPELWVAQSVAHIKLRRLLAMDLT